MTLGRRGDSDRGGGPVVSTRSGAVTVNLHQLVSQLATTLDISSQVVAVQSKLQGSTGASARSAAQQKLGITLPSASGQIVILRSDQLKSVQDIANAVKHLAIVLPVLAILLFVLAVYLARGRRRRTLRATGWCLVVIRVLLLLIRRVAGNQIVKRAQLGLARTWQTSGHSHSALIIAPAPSSGSRRRSSAEPRSTDMG